ncbi:MULTISPECIES: hypothetical protein [unclassified Pseudomonas]|uniref:hypothetical protein n=1 Tax=unclassified Pseudomonas TaxID=196821 RepID=UPI000A1E52F9|nr:MULTISPECIES: hypothetical protein [unclassified Pseudomonas]
MPIRRTGNLDLGVEVVKLTQDRLAGFLSEEELAQTKVKIVDGKLSFTAPESVLKRIIQNFGQPAG